MIVLDELHYAENLIKNGPESNYPKLKDIIILGKYYKFQGKETREIRLLLEKYCYKIDKNWNRVLSGWKIIKSLNTVKLYCLRTTFPVVVTKTEVETIKQWKDYNYQKILFVLIVIAKIFKYSDTRIKSNTKVKGINEFFVNESMSSVVKISRISLRKANRNKMFHEFFDAGILDGTTYDSLKIKCIVENSEPEIIVTDFENIVLHWARYCGERIAGCKCGKLFLQRTNMQKMCRSCWQEERKKKVRDAVKRNYYKKNDEL